MPSEKRAASALLAGIAVVEAVLIVLLAVALLRRDDATLMPAAPATPATATTRTAESSAPVTAAAPPAESITPPSPATRVAPSEPEAAVVFGTVTGEDKPLERSSYAFLYLYAPNATRPLVQLTVRPPTGVYAIPGLEAGTRHSSGGRPLLPWPRSIRHRPRCP
jgi:hypothetical protein